MNELAIFHYSNARQPVSRFATHVRDVYLIQRFRYEYQTNEEFRQLPGE